MEKLITLTIDGHPVSVPSGMNVVDAAKLAGITIPVFCHHPKLKPVGMCRLCLVDIGRPQIDRSTGKAILNEDGSFKILYGPKLETACTTPVSEGMVVWGATEKVMAARKDILEFLLTSHPLDCPVCDKGGECPLQNQTMEFGSTESRFLLDEKSRAKKHYPLGELITLDRERCIQCARCIRFSDQIADDPVIGFSKRGRAMEIISYSEPGFDSIFSGNTTDICPVGALTTNDFRFGARPWELKHKPSICTKCAVGCNITYDIRREARSNGKVVVKRIMPRQNEEVNEIWLCDKGRFTYSFNETRERVMLPLLRKDGGLTPVSWEEALNYAVDMIKAAGKNVLSVVGGHLSLEDLYSIKTLTAHIQGKISLYTNMGGGEWTTRVGMSPGSDLSKLEKGSTILVFGSDLHEEAPIWWLRVKAAAERGATLVVANARRTRLDKFAHHCFSYPYGEEENALRELFEGSSEITKSITNAENLLIFYGGDGMGMIQTTALAGCIAEGLVKTQHFGHPNNGMIATWQRANTQGAYELNLLPDTNLAESMSASMGLYIAGADPADDSPALRDAILKVGFVIVQDFFLTETAKLADVVFPAQASMEREGTLVSGERRVQKFSAAIPVTKDTREDFAITTALLEKLGGEKLPSSAPEIFALLARDEPVFQSLSYKKLGNVHSQWPSVERGEVYYGGTGYENSFGLGLTLPLATGETMLPHKLRMPEPIKPGTSQWLAVPVTKLYDQQAATRLSLLKDRISKEAVSIHPDDAEGFKIETGAEVSLKFDEHQLDAKIKVNPDQPKGTLLVTRFSGLPIWQPVAVDLRVKATAIPSSERGTP